MPQCGDGEAEENDVLRKFWCGKELADGKEVGEASNRQRNEERRLTPAAEVLRTDRQRQKQDGGESVQSVRGCKLHSPP